MGNEPFHAYQRKYRGDRLSAVVTRDRVEVVGPCNITLRLGYEGDEGKLYSNLHAQVDGREVEPFSLMLFVARAAAVEAVHLKHVDRVADPHVIAEQFIHLLREGLGGETLYKIVELNDTAEAGVCHSHDFCDANEVMSDAMESLGIDIWDKGDDEEEGGMSDFAAALWNKAWNIAMESMRLRRARPRD